MTEMPRWLWIAIGVAAFVLLFFGNLTGYVALKVLGFALIGLAAVVRQRARQAARAKEGEDG